MSPESLAELFGRHLATWPLACPSDKVRAIDCTGSMSGFYWVGWRARYAKVDINLQAGGRCYLLSIEIAEKWRGRGFGECLYSLVCDAAADAGCTEVRQTPSGYLHLSLATRRSYLLRRGWTPDGNEVYKLLPVSDPVAPPSEDLSCSSSRPPVRN